MIEPDERAKEPVENPTPDEIELAAIVGSDAVTALWLRERARRAVITQRSGLEPP